MFRRRAGRGDKKRFRKGASKMHRKNLVSATVKRGGIRL